jgi:hypothetical protein
VGVLQVQGRDLDPIAHQGVIEKWKELGVIAS